MLNSPIAVIKCRCRLRSFVKLLPKTISNAEDVKQLVRASGSVGANYIEANEALSTKDFVMRIKISRKESKESRYLASARGSRGQPAGSGNAGRLDRREHGADEDLRRHPAQERLTFRSLVLGSDLDLFRISCFVFRASYSRPWFGRDPE